MKCLNVLIKEINQNLHVLIKEINQNFNFTMSLMFICRRLIGSNEESNRPRTAPATSSSVVGARAPMSPLGNLKLESSFSLIHQGESKLPSMNMIRPKTAHDVRAVASASHNESINSRPKSGSSIPLRGSRSIPPLKSFCEVLTEKELIYK